MTALTTSQKKKLNRMNRAADDANLGTLLGVIESGSATLNAMIGFSGSKVVLDIEANGSRVPIDTGMTATGVRGYIIQAWRSGSAISNSIKVTAGSPTGTLFVSGSNLTAGNGLLKDDVLQYMGWGY
jgi:hypothetical protein